MHSLGERSSDKLKIYFKFTALVVTVIMANNH